MLFIKDPPQDKRFTQAESKGIEENIPCKCKRKRAGVAILRSDKIDFKTKAIMRQRRSLCNAKGINPKRGYNPCKHTCTQYRTT